MSSPATLEEPLPATALSPLPASLWFTAEHLADFDDHGVEREIVEGRLIEYPMSERGYLHSRVTARLGQVLGNWRDQQPEPRGDVLVGDAAFRLRRNPDTAVGVDVAYISPEQRAGATLDTFALEGPPLLAVEVYSPSDQHRRVTTKVKRYLQAGSALVWLVDPEFRTVTVYRPDAGTKTFSEGEDLTAEPHLPGFHVAVAEIFA